jgi:ketosteroid isomerase-like protein
VASDRVERARHLVELWNAGDLEGWLDEVGPDFEFTPDPSFPDAGTYSGEEFRRWMYGWIATWRENRLELLGIQEVADTILIRGRWHLVTHHTGGQVPLEDFTLVLFFDDGHEQARRMVAFFDHEKAVEAAEAGTG